jgi:hypothetical protein
LIEQLKLSGLAAAVRAFDYKESAGIPMVTVRDHFA